MKKNIILYTVFIFLNFGITKAQVGINTESPHSSSVLDINSTNMGVLAPRLTTLEKLAIVSPSEGLVVYDKDLKIYTYFNGTEWVEPSLITNVDPRIYGIISYPNTALPTTGTTFQEVAVNPSSIIKDSGDNIITLTTNSISISQTGTYLITPSAVFKKNLAGSNDVQHIKAKIIILKNGVQISETYFHLPLNGAGVFSGSKASAVFANLISGDQITLKIMKLVFADGSGANISGTFSNILLEFEKLP